MAIASIVGTRVFSCRQCFSHFSATFPYQTWTGEWFDFHGEGDLVFLSEPAFGLGLGLDVHIRTTMRYEYSFIGKYMLMYTTKRRMLQHTCIFSNPISLFESLYTHKLSNAPLVMNTQSLRRCASAMIFSKSPVTEATCSMASIMLTCRRCLPTSIP